MAETLERSPPRDSEKHPDRPIPHPTAGLDVSDDHQSGVAVASLPGGRHFELSHASARLLRLVDGRRSLDQIAELLGREDETSPDPETLERVIRARFLPLGLVSFGDPHRPLPRPRSRMWVRIPLLSAEIGGLLGGSLGFLFRRHIVLAVLVAGAAANLWMLARWGALGWDWNPARVAAGVGGVLLFLVSNLAHELGHATALRSLGERPGPIGIGMYYLFPVFYCDVSSAWRLSPRRRIRVDLGGLYFHLLFTIGLAVAFAFTGREFLLWTALMINLSMVSNLNPFLRFDGYWLMADISGVRDLRGSTRAVLRRALRRRPESGSKPASRWLYLYALASCLYFLGLAVYLSWKVIPGVLADIRSTGDLLGGGTAVVGGGSLPGDIGQALFATVVFIGILVLLGVGSRSLVLLLRADRTPGHD